VCIYISTSEYNSNVVCVTIPLPCVQNSSTFLISFFRHHFFCWQRLDKNDLKVIPESIAELPSLLSLRFRENAVISLAECFTKITTLQVLHKATPAHEHTAKVRADLRNHPGVGHVKESICGHSTICPGADAAETSPCD
jgi:hypothetical protein